MKKLILLLTLVFFVSCTQAEKEGKITESPKEETKVSYSINSLNKSLYDAVVTDQPITDEIIELSKSVLSLNEDNRIIGVGGDEIHPYVLVGTEKLDSIPVSIFDYMEIPTEQIYEWLESFDVRSLPLPDCLDEYANVRSFVKHYQISDDLIRKVLREDRYHTEEEIDLLIHGSDNEVMNAFATGYSIIIGDNFYSPYWLLNETPEKWREVGITEEMLEEKFDIYSEQLYGEKRDAMSAKLSVFFNRKIDLKTETEIIDENFSITVGDKTYYIKEILDTRTDYLKDMGITVDMLKELLDSMKGLEHTKRYDSLRGRIEIVDVRQTVFGKDGEDVVQ